LYIVAVAAIENGSVTKGDKRIIFTIGGNICISVRERIADIFITPKKATGRGKYRPEPVLRICRRIGSVRYAARERNFSRNLRLNELGRLGRFLLISTCINIGKILEIDPDAKVIVSSGYSTDPIMSEHKKYGFCGVVTKPYTINRLSEAIAKVSAE
jgi:hypothetical protein